jgi:hypothetical protein
VPVHCPPPQSLTPHRLCESCFLVRPLAEFRRRKRIGDQRMRQCRRCHNEFERYRRAAIRARVGRRRMASDLAGVRDAASARRLKALCAAMVGGYGGTEKFFEAWLDCLGRDLNRGGLAALRHLEAVVRLLQYCENDRPDYSQMDEKELIDLQASLIRQQIDAGR